MKARYIVSILFVFLITLSLSACNMPIGTANSTPDLDATVDAEVALEHMAETRVAGTLGAENPAEEPTMTKTVAAMIQLDTPTQTLTPTITLTTTPEGVFLTMTADTNCRQGAPYSAFKILATIKTGEKVEVLGRNPENDSYYVKNPYDANSKCWVYGKYATVNGDTSALQVVTMQPTPTFTPTPTPVPDFSVSYVGLETCPPNWVFKLFIKNTSDKVWQSMQISGTDTVTGFVINQSSNVFEDWVGCAVVLTQGDLTKGETSNVLNTSPGNFFVYNPTGNLINVTVRLCTQDGLLGECVAKNLSFTP